MSEFHLDKAVKQLQTIVTRLDLKQARVRRVGSSTVVYDGEPFDQIDWANQQESGAQAFIPLGPIADAVPIQSAVGSTSGGSSFVVTLADAPTDGSLLVCFQVCRSTVDPLGPSGWTAHPDGNAPNVGGGFKCAMFYKVASGDAAAITVYAAAGTMSIGCIVEVEGAGALIESVELEAQSGSALSIGTTIAEPAIILGGFSVGGSGTPTFTADDDSNELANEWTGLAPLLWFGYRIEAVAGTHALSGTTNATRDWSAQTLAFAVGAPVIWVDAPEIIDGDDTTYAVVVHDP